MASDPEGGSMTSEDVRALIDEAREMDAGVLVTKYDSELRTFVKGPSIVARLADALEVVEADRLYWSIRYEQQSENVLRAVSTPPTFTDDRERLRIDKGWPTPNHMRRAADALDALSPAKYGDVLRYVADLCDEALAAAALHPGGETEKPFVTLLDGRTMTREEVIAILPDDDPAHPGGETNGN